MDRALGHLRLGLQDHADIRESRPDEADEAAVEAMRRTFDNVPFDGRVAIGEGERDEAPMLYIGEEIGSMVGVVGAPQIDIAVDPLECTNNCASNSPWHSLACS